MTSITFNKKFKLVSQTSAVATMTLKTMTFTACTMKKVELFSLSGATSTAKVEVNTIKFINSTLGDADTDAANYIFYIAGTRS